MADHDDEDRPAYDPASPGAPEREPPLRRTAPQGPFTMRQVGIGFLIMLVGLLLTFGLPLVLV